MTTERRALPRLAALFALLGGAWGLAQAAGGFEEPPRLAAADHLPSTLLRGPHHEVRAEVASDGYWNVYTIDSPFGVFQAHGTPQVATRVKEIGALAQLAEVNKAMVAAGALGDAVGDMAKGAAHAVTNPVETAKGVGGGVKRLFGRLGRGARRLGEKGTQAVEDRKEAQEKEAAAQLSAEEPEEEAKEDEKSRGRKVAEASGGVAKSLFGVDKARREWARKLGVDPYTTNEVLHRELESVAKYDAGGRFGKNLLPLGVVGAVAETAASVDDLVWSKDPDQIQTLNEQRLKDMGVGKDDSRRLRLNGAYTLTLLTRLVAALAALEGVPGRDAFAVEAARAEEEGEARFQTLSAEMLEQLHRRRPVRELLPWGPPATARTRDGRLVALLPVDHLAWTEELAGQMETLTHRARRHRQGARREAWLSGRASARTQRELRDRGWTVRQRTDERFNPRPS